MADTIIELKKGEGKWIKFTVVRGGAAVDLTSATLAFGVKKKISDAAYIHYVSDLDFDKASAAAGIVRANIPSTLTASLPVGDYDGELKIILTADTDVDKSHRVVLKIRPAIIHD
jgi:hypothetical protein